MRLSSLEGKKRRFSVSWE